MNCLKILKWGVCFLGVDSLQPLYHIVSANEWSSESQGDYLPKAFEREGFIHFSKKEQLLDSANRHFSNEESLLVLEVNPQGLEDDLVLEQIHGAQEAFPHLYRSLPRKNVIRQFSLQKGPLGFAFKPDVTS